MIDTVWGKNRYVHMHEQLLYHRELQQDIVLSA